MPEQGKKINRRIGDRYEIRRLLGSGGMADVYLAHDARLMRDIALKILRFDPSLDTEHIEEQKVRLLREARAAARLSHPGIVVIHDLGESEGRPFISMEYIQGRNLREMLREYHERGQGIPVGLILNIARQVAAALDYAHSQNVIHRDIKPENIMITPEGVCKITDFGIARSYVAGLRTLTPHGKLVCTYHYAAPEYFQGGEANAHGDQFSLGCVLYELFTGRFAFGGEEMHQVWYRITQVTPVPPSDIAFGLPESVNPIILKMLAKTPDKRYRSCLEAVTALETVLTNLDISLHFQDKDQSDETDCPSFLPTGDDTLAAPITESGTNRPSDGNLPKSIPADTSRKTQPLFIGTKNLWWGALIIFIAFGVLMVILENKTKFVKFPVLSEINDPLPKLPGVESERPVRMPTTENVMVRSPESEKLSAETSGSMEPPTSSPEWTNPASESVEPTAAVSIPVITDIPVIGDLITPTQEQTDKLIDDVTADFILSPTPEKTITPERTRTPTPKKTATPEPTWTETPTSTRTATPSPAPTLTATPNLIQTPDMIRDDLVEGLDGDRMESAAEGDTSKAVIADDSGNDVTVTPMPSATSSPTGKQEKKKREPWVPF
ncbi:MAG: protein kinase [bacterium]